MDGTGGGSPCPIKFSDMELKLLDFLGPDASGLSGVEQGGLSANTLYPVTNVKLRRHIPLQSLPRNCSPQRHFKINQSTSSISINAATYSQPCELYKKNEKIASSEQDVELETNNVFVTYPVSKKLELKEKELEMLKTLFNIQKDKFALQQKAAGKKHGGIVKIRKALSTVAIVTQSALYRNS